MTKGEVGIQQLVNQYIAGDPRARRDVMEIADKLGIDIWAKHRSTIEEALAPKDQEILDAYVKRHSGAKDLAAAEPVLAPPELLDDDVAEKEATVASPPTAVTEPEPGPEPEPAPKPGVKYPKPFSRMTRSERRAWYPEWYAENLKREQEKDRAKAEAKAKAKENAEENAKENAQEQKAAPPLDQASLGRGDPPTGGFSRTTGKWS